MEKVKILMLEDLEEDAGLVDRVLQKEKMNYVRLRVDTQREFAEALENFKPDIILSDHSLPQFNSIEALKICQERKLNLPFILVTGAVSEEFAVSCLKKGADDYVLKSNLSRLPLAINYALRHRGQENIRKEQEELLHGQNVELTKINKELDSFVYSVSHNLRSPLASVLGLVNLALLDSQKSPEMVERYFKMIAKNISKLDETLRHILNYSRNARSDGDITEINLERLIRECFASVKYLEMRRQIRKQIDMGPEVAPFYSDAYRLSVILSNILSNAMKYCDETKEESFIQVAASVTSTSAVIRIRDNGTGIHPDYLPEIYNMFYRATEKGEGSGLGLYIVKEMVEKMNGTVTITSVLNESTEITLTLPNAEPGK